MDEMLIGQPETQAADLRYGRIDAFVLALTAPFLLLPSLFLRVLPLTALVVLFVPTALRLVRRERLTRPTAANLPVALLAFVVLPLAFLLSPVPWAITGSRVTTLAWSIALYFVVINWSPPLGRDEGARTRLGGPTLIYLGLGVLTAVVGLLGMRSVDKLFSLPGIGMLTGQFGGGAGLPTNEIAGMLTLFIPFAVALAYGAWITGRWRPFVLLALPALVMLAALAFTQSRTGIAATAAGTVLALLVGRRMSLKWVSAGLIVLGAALLLASLTPLLDWSIFAGANSWDSVVRPRLDIWRQAVVAIGDHPLWGMGLGVFGPLARLVYPLVAPEAVPVLEDAHNLYLQTAVDLGLAGAFVFLTAAGIVFVAAARLVRARPPYTLTRLWAAGLLGALLAHALYSLTDAVALGTLAGVPLWFAFGLVMNATRDRLRETWTTRARLAFVAGLALVLALSALGLRTNRAGQLAVSALVAPPSEAARAAAEIGPLAATACRARWYEGLAYHAAGDGARRAAAWGALLDCTPGYTGYMAALAGDDVELARRAVTAQPESAAGYFWLGLLAGAETPDEGAALYRRGLRLSPGDGAAWLALADMLRYNDPAAAEEAYLQACRHGDPGANGCLRAGTLAEARGDTATAIEYYRLSNWEGAQEKAAALERLLPAP